MKSNTIRQRFFDFFTKRGHTKVPSSSLIPAQDPTLLFTNAGMNQFKDVFLGKEKRSYDRAVSIQKCVRAGGKHNDLENVGFTKRHLTFFEMMGNFSFGDYFKKDAIKFAWDFLTKDLKIPAEKLHVSVFETDDESYNIWKDVIGLPPERIHRLGAEENFWQMGDVGPCGPCTEIYIDRGPEYGCGKKECGPGCDCDRFLEVWNLVFMQYDRQPDGTDVPLKQKGVDTGMGLERLACIMQDKDSVFETDLFKELIEAIEKLTGKKYAEQSPELKAAFHVLADHVRSASLLIADGCAPSNEGRGYVLRKIIRRAALFAQKLSDNPALFPELSQVFVQQMGDIYPELKEQAHLIKKILTSEINKFAENLVRGQTILERYFDEQKDSKVITGQQAFKLYDTFGFPIELVILMAKERGYTVDQESFEKHMAEQREKSGKKMKQITKVQGLPENLTTEFTGYDELETESSVIALVKDNVSVNEVEAGQTCYVITKRSPFFIVGGGQVPDNGWLIFDHHQAPLTEVKFINGAIAVKIKAPVTIKVGDTVISKVNKELRINAMKNHTATHLLQAALIELFGPTIKQSGSLVHPDYLRFDFTYHENLSPEDIKRVEDLVNAKIRENIPVNIEYTTLKQATDRGVIAFFGDKYNPDKVRVVEIPGFSAELCGGTHVVSTGDIGTFKITEATALSAGHRRIVALTGPRSIELFQDTFNDIKNLSQQFKVKREEVVETIEKQTATLKSAQQEIKQLKKLLCQVKIPQWVKRIEQIGKIPFLFIHLDGMGNEELRDIAGQLMSTKSGFYVLVGSLEGKHLVLCSLAPKLITTMNLKEFGTWAKEKLGLRGGGSPEMFQGGMAKFDPSMEKKIKEWVAAHQG